MTSSESSAQAYGDFSLNYLTIFVSFEYLNNSLTYCKVMAKGLNLGEHHI